MERTIPERIWKNVGSWIRLIKLVLMIVSWFPGVSLTKYLCNILELMMETEVTILVNNTLQFISISLLQTA